MISVSEARKIIAAHTQLQMVEYLPIANAIGHVLADDIVSLYSVPSFDNAAMDGYAFQFSDSFSSYNIVGTIEAGKTDIQPVNAGQAVRIFTGAPIPDGVDTVIQQEIAQVQGNVLQVDVQVIKCGANVRKVGTQSGKGNVAAKKGSILTPGLIGLLASVGIAEAPVYAAPTVGIISTGSELQELGTPLNNYRIYNSNAFALKAYLTMLGIKSIGYYHAEDNIDSIRKKIKYCLEHYDILIMTGGVSVGDYDFVYDCLQQEDVTQLFYKVRQKPGKPLFAGKRNSRWAFALPGNPTAVITCFNQYVKPCIRAIMGHADAWHPSHTLSLKETYKKEPGLTHFLKGKTEGGEVKILQGQESFNLSSFNDADCFIEIPDSYGVCEAGTRVHVYSW